jgi:3-oxoacyl-[acyl-carrier protein] reductase
MDDRLKGALVTGASRGIGRAIAEALAGAGFAVIGTATSSAGAEQITARFVEKNFVGQGMVLNVNDTASISLLLKEVDENFGAPTVLVNNAGITKDNILLRMKEDEWSDVVNTNLNAVFRLSKACVRAMTKAKWGRIVNISSVVGSMGNSGQSNYSATKAGVEGFSRALAKELGSRNITVNTVAPGFIDTDMTKKSASGQ